MCVSVSCDPVSNPPALRSGVTGATASSVESFGCFSETTACPAHDTGRGCRRQDHILSDAARHFGGTHARNFRYAAPMATPETPLPSRQINGAGTIADIAARTGVSVPTVSKVINGRSDVAPETRRRVEAAIRDVGYERPSRAGTRAPLLEVIFHELESEWALEIVRGVERVAGQHHLAVVLSEMQGRRTPGRGWIEGVLARRPTGVIAVFSDLSRRPCATSCAPRDIPLVAVDPTGEPLHDMPSVGATNWNGGLDRDPAPARPRASPDRRDRRAGADPVQSGPTGRLSGGHGRGRMCRSIRVSSATAGSTSMRASSRAAQLLRLPDRPTAIFAGQRPPGARRLPGGPRAPAPHPRRPQRRRLRRPAGREMGRPAPDDDPPAADGDGGDGGRARPWRMADGEQPAQTRVELATELVIRESTAPPPG